VALQLPPKPLLNSQQPLQWDIPFRTANHQIENAQPLKNLATLLKAHPDLRIQLDGYADPRGNSDYNQDLSQKRAAAIVNYLTQQGIDPARIQQQAHGESATAVTPGDIDGYALERKVSVKVFNDTHAQVADR